MTATIPDNARVVLEQRYLRRDDDGAVIETADGMFHRVAEHVAAAEARFDGGDPDQWTDRFNEAMASLEFLPNSPTLMNAGTPLGQLSACFVLPVGDAMSDIFDALKHMALIQQSGGGTGFAFSRLRPAGDVVASTGGKASGPVSFMGIFDCATERIRQGGRRRGANMGVLRVDHPDIERFIDAKGDGASFRNFNLSVGATDSFMAAVQAGGEHDLVNPRTGTVTATVDARSLFAHIARAAWATGDPGLIFLDTINRANPTPVQGAIESTNPCGEVPLLPYEACTLGSINLARMTHGTGPERTIDWDHLGDTVDLAVRFLDNVVEVGRWPAAPIAAAVHGNRKIGLGVMGLAELFIMLGLPYASEQATEIAGSIAKFMAERAAAASEALAETRGAFPNFAGSVLARTGRPRRNATVLSIAPAGTLGIIAGTSSGIEPLFALAYRREALDGRTLPELNPLFLRHARDHGRATDAIEQYVADHGSLDGCPGIDEPTRELFGTALEIPPAAHLRIQAAFQQHVDNAVSKTINLPEDATPEDVAAIYMEAWSLGVKGITVYRYGSRESQVLTLGIGEAAEDEHAARCDPESCRL